MRQVKARVKFENREGMLGWLTPKYNLERLAYTMQRITGFTLALYFVAHVVETSSIVGGRESWESMLAATQNPLGHLVLVLVAGAAVYHAANGVRLVLTHFGILVGSPARPDYPYKPKSLGLGQKLLLLAAVLLTAAALAYSFLLLFLGV